MINPNVEQLESLISAVVNNLYKEVPPTEDEFLEKATLLRNTNAPIMPVSDDEFAEIISRLKQSEARSALRRAQYLCEVDNSHFVFKRRNRSDNYTEPHHLVPLSAHRDFPGIDLDREQNIVSLFSNCHNILHYGASYKEILYELYIQRRELLKQIGIVISFEQLVSYY